MKIELMANIKAYSQSVALLALSIPLALVGYATLCLSLCIALSQHLGLRSALLLLGGAHVVGAATCALVAVRKLRGVDPMHESAYEAKATLSFAGRVSNGKPP